MDWRSTCVRDPEPAWPGRGGSALLRRARWAVTLCLSLALAGEALAAPTVRFAPERDYGPFVYLTEEGRIAGLSIDILDLLVREAGLEITMLPARPLAEQLAATRRGEVDLLSSLRPTAERGAFLQFSIPYVSVPAVLVARAKADAPVQLRELQGQKVAVGAGYAVEAHVRAGYPQVQWEAVSDDVSALRGVVEGRFAAAVVDLASFHFVTRQHQIVGLEPSQRVGFEYRLSFAAPLGRADLIQRIDDALVKLPASKRQAVLDRWMPPDTLEAPRRAPWATAIALGLLGLSLLVAAAGWWWRRKRPA